MKAIISDDVKVIEKELKSLPPGSEVRFMYALHGRHVAWVETPAPIQTTKKRDKGATK